ncbi:MAG: ABC transporter permease [Propionibacteriaceae bacterium]|nr:ABC transporter permease [Propionibacteriaceae bacterium]
MSELQIAPDKPALRTRAMVPVLLPWVMVILLYCLIIIKAPGYRQGPNIAYLLQILTILGLVALGQMFVILIGGIDLSVSTVMTLGNLVSAVICAKSNTNLLLAVLVSLAVGAVIGLLNGLIIAKLGVPDMVATLAMMTAVLGAGYLFSNGRGQGNAAPLLVSFVKDRVFGVIPPATIALAVVAVIVILTLRKTTFGRQVYAVGLSRSASHAAGVSITRTVILLYVISGVCASAAGILLTGYNGASFLNSGNSYQLQSIAAVVLGGANIFGGSGGYGNTIAGAGIICLLLALLLASSIPTAGQNILYGVVILVMLVVFRFSGNRDTH